MSEDYADETMKTIVSWGRYAELFAYDEQSETFSLENPTLTLRSVVARSGSRDVRHPHLTGWNVSARAIAQASR